MESLLTVSFANLSSRDNTRIRKGLRQIEGLLAQVCLSSARLSPHKRSRSELPAGGKADRRADAKAIKELRNDAAFREFFRLQEGFGWNGISSIHPEDNLQAQALTKKHLSRQPPHSSPRTSNGPTSNLPHRPLNPFHPRCPPRPPTPPSTLAHSVQ